MILSLDCSTLTLSLALLRADGTLVEYRLVGPPQRQSEVLPGEIEKLLTAHGFTLQDVTGFVVGLGPGSFTGLRIGLATIKGLAYALKVPIVGASSLAALAVEGPRETELFATAVVKKGEFYVRRVAPHPGPLPAAQGEGERSMTLAELADALKAAPAARMIGPALTDWRAPLEALGVPAASFLAGPLVPSAVALATLVTMPAAYDAQALFALEPHYLRGSGAEENPKFPPLPGVEPKARLKED
ncbi:MAG: tRNA (adenosine(37)-N6)-threonylcarbamoyltransferase complex dimerization subunit type 1 TsaB [Archangium sp.]|nr:tRNA (adenosine(37)-N6)-threonylcarbamoyltransferase complex dimerization subunit type 1 TsaB [Archangium sp.]